MSLLITWREWEEEWFWKKIGQLDAWQAKTVDVLYSNLLVTIEGCVTFESKERVF